MKGIATWRESSKEFFNERAEGIRTKVSAATLCYVSGREQRLWTNPALYEDMMESIREQLDAKPDQTLLEVGCAAGFMAPGLAKMVGKYFGADIAAQAVEVARSLGIGNAEFKVGDGVRLPWPDGTFERVIAYEVFTNFPSFEAVAKVVRDMVRVCRPGGKVMAGSLPDEEVKEAFQEKVYKVGKELDDKYGPVPSVAENHSVSQRLRRWFNQKVLRVKPEIVCYYFRRADFMKLAQDLGVPCTLNDIHPLNPYHGYRFNAVFSKPRNA